MADLATIYLTRYIAQFSRLKYKHGMESDEHIIRSIRQAGLALRSRRKSLGWTQGEVARRAGTKQATVSDIENGIVAASLETYLALMTALNAELLLVPRSSDASLTDLSLSGHSPTNTGI